MNGNIDDVFETQYYQSFRVITILLECFTLIISVRNLKEKETSQTVVYNASVKFTVCLHAHKKENLKSNRHR